MFTGKASSFDLRAQAALNLLNMAVIGTATTTEDIQLRKPVTQAPMQLTELFWIAIIEFLCLVKFCMTLPRRVCT